MTIIKKRRRKAKKKNPPEILQVICHQIFVYIKAFCKYTQKKKKRSKLPIDRFWTLKGYPIYK